MWTLYQMPISHYCEKARWNLDHKRVAYRVRNVLPGLHRIIAKRVGARGSVPILVDGDRTLDDSTDIALHFERAVADRPLLPKDDATRARVLAEEAFFDDVAGPAIRIFIYGELMRSSPSGAAKVFFSLYRSTPVALLGRLAGARFESVLRKAYRIDDPRIETARARVLESFDRIDAAIAGDERRYLVGDTFSLADLTAASLLSPIVAPIGSPYRGIAVPSSVAHLVEEARRRPAWRWVERIYRDHRV